MRIIKNNFLASLTALALLVGAVAVLSPKASAANTTAVFPGRSCPSTMTLIAYNQVGEYTTCAVKKAAESPKKATVKKQNKQRQTEAVNNAIDSEPEILPSDSQPPKIVSNSSYTSKPAVASTKPEVTILAYTSIKSTGKRIGSVKIKLERNGGDERCNNRKKLIVPTNPVASVHGKKTKGLVSWIGCTAGTYTVTNLGGRKGYAPVGNTTRTLNASDFGADNQAHVYFSVEKAPKATTSKNGGVKAN